MRGPAAGNQEAAGAGEERVNIPWRFGIFCGENIYKGLRIWYLSKMDGVRASAVPKRQSVTNGRVILFGRLSEITKSNQKQKKAE